MNKNTNKLDEQIFSIQNSENLIIGDGTISQLEALAITLPTPIASDYWS